MSKRPKLKTVQKYKPPYEMNKFSSNFPYDLGRELVYLIASRGSARLEGQDWEEIFARIVKAQWKPSNVGLDDIVFQQTAWGAKTVKNKNPATVSKIRLIAGRNSPVYSYDDTEVSGVDANILGGKVLEIWNERVAGVRKKYKELRTVVLIKSDNLLEASVYETDTLMYPTELFWWQWNENNNLEGYVRKNNEHIFTWQPHGSQFTIIENVPKERLSIRIKKQPPAVNKEDILKAIKYDNSWIEIIS